MSRFRRAFHLDVRRADRTAADVDEELRFHVEMRAEQLVAQGWSREAAEAEARRRFGASWPDAVRELHEQGHLREHRLAMRERLAAVTYDLRHAVRALRRDWRYALGVVLTLALGLGATTTIASLVDQVLVRPLPYEAPGRLLVAREIATEVRDQYPSIPANAHTVNLWRAACTGCEGIAAIKRSSATMQGEGDPQRFGAARVSDNLFSLLGVRPLLGRDFARRDGERGAPRVALLSNGFWRRQFGADPSVVGRAVRINDNPVEIVGVLPPGVDLPGGDGLGAMVGLPRQVDVYFPFIPSDVELNNGGMFDLAAIVRMKPGATMQRVEAELDAVVATQESPRGGEAPVAGKEPPMRATVLPLHEQVVGAQERPLFLLLGAVGAVLLIVCTNLASLALARDAGRRREAAVRVALGASRGRLTRLALFESLALAVAGGGLGLALAWGALRLLVRLAPATLPRIEHVGLDGRAFALAALVALVTGIGVGIVPALRRGSAAPGEALRSSSRSATAGKGAARRRAVFIGAQVAVGTVLLAASGLFVASLLRVLEVDRGFDAERVLAVDVALPGARYDSTHKLVPYYDRAIAALAAVPGVRSAAVTNGMPLEGETWVDGVLREEDRGMQEKVLTTNMRFTSPGFLATVGTPLRRGRDFAPSDRGGARVAIISERTARALWPGQDPIGHRILATPGGTPAQVIGVAADVRASSLEAEPTSVVYLPAWEVPQWSVTFVVRAAGDPASLAPAVRAALRGVDAAVPVPRVRTSGEILAASVAARRFQVALLAVLALMAFVTASVGIYGVISQSLAGRGGEIGVRLALGARPGDVHRLVVREGMTPVAIGLALGLAASVALGTVLASQLFEVEPTDPATMLAVAALLGTVGVVACLVPARRATRRGLAELMRFE